MLTNQILISQALRELQSGNLAAAEASCARILSANPSDADALNLRGMIAHQARDFASAIGFYQRAIASRPDVAAFYNNLGLSLSAFGRHHEAAGAYHRATILDPSAAVFHFNLGNALRDLGAIDQAIVALQQAARLDPSVPEFPYTLGLTFTAGNRFAEAVEAFRATIRLKDDHADAWMNLGIAFQQLGQTDSALGAHRRAIALRPNYAEGHHDYAMALQAAGDLDGTIAEFQKAISLRPDFVLAWTSLGIALGHVGRIEEAMSAYRQAVAIQVDYPRARRNLAMLLLLRGDYANGFLEYEWRWKATGEEPRLFDRTRWTGEDPAGKRVFICDEQGFGDTIQFARYAQWLKDRGAKVILGCAPQLARLMDGCAGVEQVVAKGEPMPAFDVFCPAMSLPLFCRTTTLDNVPTDVPYIRVAEDLKQSWKDRVSTSNLLKVGLCWSGSPTNPDRFRSIPFEHLSPLTQVAGVDLHSLQVGSDGTEQLRRANFAISDQTAHLTDFADTAALIEQLDLVISVDTSVAHLTGALGKPLWILLSCEPDWRWLLERSDNPWYPSARLFRFRESWDQVIGEVTIELSRLANPK